MVKYKLLQSQIIKDQKYSNCWLWEMGGKNIYYMFSCHHPTASTIGLAHGERGQGRGRGQKREQGKGNPSAVCQKKKTVKIVYC
jgi:hypothetical protein